MCSNSLFRVCFFVSIFISSCLIYQVSRLTSAGNAGGGGTYRINKLQTEVKDLQSQLKQSEGMRATLEQALDKVKDGKVILYSPIH